MTKGKNSARDNGYESNKEVVFDHIQGIYIKNFRSLKDKQVKLGRRLTLITGKNGTMKSCLLGLIAHPFSSPNNAKDNFDNDLKTDARDVFKLSFIHDKERYVYYLQAKTNTNKCFDEKIRLYQRENENRFRVTVGPDNKKDRGNFLLNTSFVSLKRLYPMIDTKSKADKNDQINHSENDMQWLNNAYINIIQRDTFKKTEKIKDTNTKSTYGPAETYYNFKTMSSGEDNLGAIFNKMIAFEKFKTHVKNEALNGILCIDEIEASLHPISQIRLIDFLKRWAEQNNIQVVVSTHSLYIIEHCLTAQKKYQEGCADIVINNISTVGVGINNNYNIMINPAYDVIYKELTYNDINDAEALNHKVNLIVEDQDAKNFINQILYRKSHIKKNISFIINLADGENKGDSWTALRGLAKNAKKLLNDSIVIVDPDVKDADLKDCDPDYIFKIPDINSENLAIEKRIVSFINKLNNDDEFFTQTIKKERGYVVTTFADAGIQIDKISDQKTALYKNWKDKNKPIFNAGLKLYIKRNKHTFDEFEKLLVDTINKKRSRYALPPILIK